MARATSSGGHVVQEDLPRATSSGGHVVQEDLTRATSSGGHVVQEDLTRATSSGAVGGRPLFSLCPVSCVQGAADTGSPLRHFEPGHR